MEYTALYRKFRPITFSEIVGQEHIIKTLKNQLISGRVGHAYLFNGGRGTGKTTTAKILARAVNCLNPKNGEPCNECEICKGILDGSLTDIIEMDAASNNSVEDVRSIREAVNFLPTKAKYRVYIIDEVHMLSISAFNALLKTLEEPPEHVKFILATTEPQKLPATILSRCQRFDFKRISNEDIVKNLEHVSKESNIKISKEALNLISILSEGAMRDALSILERCMQDGEEIDEDKIKDLVGIPKTIFINELVNFVVDKDVEKTLEKLQEIVQDGKDINNLIWEIIKYIKDVLLYKTTGKTEIYNDEEIANIKKISEKVSKQELIDLICELSKIENDVKYSTQKLIILQTGLISLCNKKDIEDTTKNSSTNNGENRNGNNSNLEERVTKIENFLRAGNFVKGKSSAGAKVTFNNGVEEKKEKPLPKPKYQGKTQDYWPKLVNDFKSNGKMFMYINLAGTIAREINDMTLEVEFPNGMNSATKEFLTRPDTMQDLRETIHLACGKEMQIKFVDDKKDEEVQTNDFEKFISGTDLPFNII